MSDNSNKLCKTLYFMLLFEILMFSFATLTYTLYPFINRVIGYILIPTFLGIYLLTIRKKDILILFLFAGVALISFVMANNFSKHLNDCIYYCFYGLLLWKLADNNFSKSFVDTMNRHLCLIKLFSIIEFLTILICLLVPSSYKTSWEDTYFSGLAYGSHALCCGICISASLFLFTIKKNSSDLLGLFVLTVYSYAILQSGARTYLVSLFAIWIIYFKYLVNNKEILKLFIPLIFVAGIYILFNSNFMQKMNFTVTNEYASSENKLSNFTSGRLDFWLIDLNAYKFGTFLQLLFGQGFDSVYYINLTQYGLNIWAHNDFINSLLCNGIFGLIVYCIPMIKLFKVKHRNKIMNFSIFIFVFGVAFINGMFGYAHYLFAICMFSMVLRKIDYKKKADKNIYNYNAIRTYSGIRCSVEYLSKQ